MPEDINQISILTRREIEARIAGPLIKAFMEELDSDKALIVVKRVIEPLARESGNQLAIQVGGNSMHDFAKGMKTYWESGGAYEKEELEGAIDEFKLPGHFTTEHIFVSDKSAVSEALSSAAMASAGNLTKAAIALRSTWSGLRLPAKTHATPGRARFQVKATWAIGIPKPSAMSRMRAIVSKVSSSRSSSRSLALSH